VKRATLALAAALSVALPLAAHAHRPWLLPSMTAVSGNDQWVTVDAAVTTDLFYFDHNPMRLDGLVVTAPDGSPATASNSSTGKLRSSFDVQLAKPGTYQRAVVGDTLTASYKVGAETKRARGSLEQLTREIPAGASDLSVTRLQTRTETFVTAGKPDTRSLAPSNSGREMVPVSHPNDLVSGAPASFRLLLDGKPAAGYEVSAIPGGNRYRDALGEIKTTTDADGRFTFAWPAPGMYWMNAGTRAVRGAPGGSLAAPARRVTWSAVVEVMPN
jgi:uncharacterized GH25 family protein